MKDDTNCKYVDSSSFTELNSSDISDNIDDLSSDGTFIYANSDDDFSDDDTCIYASSDEDITDNSSNFSTDEFDNITRNRDDALKFYYTNADCLLNKIDELEVVIQQKQPDIVVVTEVYPKNRAAADIDSNEYKLNGYQCFKSDVQDGTRGVLIYAKQDISIDFCRELRNDEFKESIWCEIRTEGEKLLLGAVYKSPSSDRENQEKLFRLINKAVDLGHKHFVMIGDFNFPDIDWRTWTVNGGEGNLAFQFVECIRDNFLFQHILEDTRYRMGQLSSCLDLLFTNSEDIIENLSFGDKLGASDHVSVTFDVKCHFVRKIEELHRPNFFKGKYIDIKNYLQEVEWDNMLNLSIDDAWNFFKKHFNHCIDTFIPVKNTKKKFVKPKWMDHYCVRKVKKKYHAWKRFTYSHSYHDYEAYCKARNSATKAVRFSKKKFQKGVAECAKKSPKSFWAYVKDQTKSKGTIGDLVDNDGHVCTDDVDKAHVLNNFFATVFTREGDEEIPTFTPKVQREESIGDIVIDKANVEKLIKQLDASKSCGPDNCHPFFLKECATELSRPLAILFRKSIDCGRLPKDWKEANVTCIFKKGDKSAASNYRPVSLTSVVCKLLEKVIKEALLQHMDKHKLLSDCQFGFRKHRHTILQLLTVLEDWTNYIDNDEQIDTVYFDFRKAFDSVPHKRLIHKVEGYGVSGKLLTWLQDFLNNRRQRVVVNGASSGWTDVLSGIPQGSILGPILFIIFVNDLPEVVGNVCKLFADDCKLYKNIKCKTDQIELQEDIDRLCNWSEKWLLKFNVTKCKSVSYGNMKLPHQYTLLDDNGQRQNLTIDQSEKDLGIQFTRTLSFDDHINNLVNKVNKITGLIRRTFKFMDKSLFLTLYKSLIRSHLDYGNLVYYPSTKKNKQIIENAQRRATRIVPELRGLNYEQRLKELNLTTLDYRRKRYDLIQTFRIIRNEDDIKSSVFFKLSESDLRGHPYKLVKPRANKSTRLNSFSHRVVSAWNNLPAEIVCAKDTVNFKTKLDQYWSEKRFDTTDIYY